MHVARLAQSVEHGTLSPRVVGSSPTLGEILVERDHNTLKERNDNVLFEQKQNACSPASSVGRARDS